MRWKVVSAYTDAAAAEKEITDSEKLLIVAQAGIENATTHNKPDQFKFCPSGGAERCDQAR